MSEVDGPESAYQRLIELPDAAVQNHQAYWALRAHLEQQTGRSAASSYMRATSLSEDPAVRAFLQERMRAI